MKEKELTNIFDILEWYIKSYEEITNSKFDDIVKVTSLNSLNNVTHMYLPEYINDLKDFEKIYLEVKDYLDLMKIYIKYNKYLKPKRYEYITKEEIKLQLN